MTQDEIIAMAREAGFKMENSAAMQAAKAFYKLATAKEREACAKECWKQMGLLPTQAWSVNPYEQCINAIRARGEQA